MNEKKQCALYLDLLPLYKEGLVQPETAKAVAEHINQCADCRKAYERLNDDKLPIPAKGTTKETAQKTAPLRKFRFHFWMNILGLPLWLPLLLAAIMICFALWVTLFSVIIVAWCLPLTTVCVAITGIPALAVSCISGFGGNALFSAGLILAGLGLTVPLACLCQKLTVLFFRGSAWICKKTFLRKFYAKKNTQPKGATVK